MNKKTCCITGHRDIPSDKLEALKAHLRREIEAAIADGYAVFLSGMAQGVDLLFAELVIDQRKQYPHLFLEAAIPYRNRLNSKDPVFQKCLSACNGMHVQQENYSRDALLSRNRYMVSHSSRVIAVYDGRSRGGTLFTLRYAHALGREVREISLS